jgi:antirestriction protein ArdC
MSTNENTSTQTLDMHARVPSRFINAIDQGASRRKMPWYTSGRFAFSSVTSTARKPHRGIVADRLWTTAKAKGYVSGEWSAGMQFESRVQVRKSENSADRPGP